MKPMEELVLKVSGIPIEAPNQIKKVTDQAGNLGERYVQYGVRLFLAVIVVMSVFYMLWGAIDWILSQGDKQKVAAARAKFTYAIIGLIIAFLSFFIISVVARFLDIRIVNF